MTSYHHILPSTSATTATAEHGGTTSFSDMHPDIIDAHILTRLDGPSLASISCSSTTLHHLSSQDQLWSRICHSTWPSTAMLPISQLISAFPNGGYRAFFTESYSLPHVKLDSVTSLNPSCSSLPPELISAVDIHYKNKLIFTKVHAVETASSWFMYSPFRIDLLDPKDVVSTKIKHPNEDVTCMAMHDDMILSWILIDPIGKRAVNLSSHKPISVQRHWLSGEVHVIFSLTLSTKRKVRKIFELDDHMQCLIKMTCGTSRVGEMQVREVSLKVEDMDGTHLNGKDSLAILESALKGEKGNGANKVEIGRKRYKEFLEMKKVRKEKKLKTEGALDILGVIIGVTILVALSCFLFYTK